MKTARTATLTLLFAGVAGCGISGDDARDLPIDFVNDVVSVAALQSRSAELMTIDLRVGNHGYLIESMVDTERVLLICPSGAEMSLSSLMREVGLDAKSADQKDTSATLMFTSLIRDPRTESAPICDLPCYLHLEPNRTWVCFC